MRHGEPGPADQAAPCGKPDVVGIDPDGKALSRARRKADRRHLAVRFDHGFAVQRLPYSDGSFDLHGFGVHAPPPRRGREASGAGRGSPGTHPRWSAPPSRLRRGNRTLRRRNGARLQRRNKHLAGNLGQQMPAVDAGSGVRRSRRDRAPNDPPRTHHVLWGGRVRGLTVDADHPCMRRSDTRAARGQADIQRRKERPAPLAVRRAGEPRQRASMSTAHPRGSSGRGESHPPALSEPDVSLSAHPAPIIRPSGSYSQPPVRKECRVASATLPNECTARTWW